MEDGCILVSDYECSELKVRCNGDARDKRSCPIWGNVVAAEEYYDRKLRREAAIGEDY